MTGRESLLAALREALVGVHLREFGSYGLCWCSEVNPMGAGLAPDHTPECRAAKAALEANRG